MTSPISSISSIIIPSVLAGKRLDKALLFFYPKTSLRERRRWIENGLVRLGGQAVYVGLKVRAGQEFEILANEDEICGLNCNQSVVRSDDLSGVRIVAEQNGLVALYKPPGVHSQKGKEVSVEDILPKLISEKAFLLNRLDFLTSGIVLATLSEKVRREYLEAQQRGKLQKIYLAVVLGRVGQEFVCTQAIDSRKRQKVRVLTKDAPIIRHTAVRPLQILGDTTLVEAQIAKGCRHQIRSHLSAAGFPIVGDPLYGKKDVVFFAENDLAVQAASTENTERLYLHHSVFCWEERGIRFEVVSDFLGN